MNLDNKPAEATDSIENKPSDLVIVDERIIIYNSGPKTFSEVSAKTGGTTMKGDEWRAPSQFKNKENNSD